MKKFLSALMCLALCLSILPESFADGDRRSAGQKLQAYGLVKGDENGNLLEHQNLKRQDALLLLLRILGEDRQAESYTGQCSFKDVAPGSYYYKAIAYAENRQLTKGMGNASFGVDRLVSEKEMLAFILRSLGYQNVSWDDVMGKADQLGITNGLYPDPNASTIRAKAFEYMLAGLYTEVNGTKEKLGVKLGIKGFDEAKGVPDKKNEDKKHESSDSFRVAEINASSLKTIDIVFSDKVQAYDVDKSNIKVDRASYKLLLREDGKTVSILFYNPQKQDAKMKVKIKRMKSKSGDLIKDYEKEVLMEDKTAPKLLESKFLDLRTLKLTFSEPVRVSSQSYSATNFLSLDGKNPSIKIDKNSYGDELIVSFKEAVRAGSHKLGLTKIKDYANNSLDDEYIDINAERDDSAPRVTKVEFLNRKQVLVYFDEPLHEKGQFKIDNKFAGSKKYFDDKKDILEIAFPSEINIKALDKGILMYKGQEDRSRNRVSDWESADFEVQDDTELPSAEVRLESGNNVVIEFDKPMNENYGFVALYDKNNEKKLQEIAKRPFSFEANSQKKVLKLHFDKIKDSGEYYIRVEGFRDLSLRGNMMIRVEEMVRGYDGKKPGLVYDSGKRAVRMKKGRDKNEDTISIRFTEPMDTDDLRNLSNYRISNLGTLSNVDGVSIEGIYDDDRTVVITVPDARKFGSGTRFTIMAIRDKSGNMMDTVDDARLISGVSSFRLSSATVLKKNEILLTFTKEVETFDTGAFELRKNSDEVEYIDSYEIDERDKKKVRITLRNEINNMRGYRLVSGGYVDSIRSIYGDELYFGSSISIVDKTGAYIEDIEAVDGRFIVKMSEAVLFKDSDAKSVSQNILITDERSGLLVNGTDYLVEKANASDADYVKTFLIKGKKDSPNTFKQGESYTIGIIKSFTADGEQSSVDEKTVVALGEVQD